MPIEVWGSDDAGHLMLMPDPLSGRDAPAPDAAPAPPTPDTPLGEPPLAEETAPAATPPPPDDLTALRRMIEAREASDRARELRDAQRDAQLETVTRVLSGAAPPLPETPPTPTGPPQAEQYASHEDYVLAAARYGAQQELQARDQQAAQERQQAQQIAFQQQLMQREATFKEAHPDFDQVVRAGLAGKVSPILQQALMLVPDGPSVAYTLARQPELVQRLNTLPPPLVLVELGRLSPPPAGGVPPAAGETVPPPGGTLPPAGGVPLGRPKPPPPRPLSGTGVAPIGGFRDDMSMAEYRQWKQQHNIT